MDKQLSIDIIADALGSAYQTGGFPRLLQSARQIHDGVTGYNHLPARKSALNTVVTQALRGRLGQVTVMLEGADYTALQRYRESLTDD